MIKSRGKWEGTNIMLYDKVIITKGDDHIIASCVRDDMEIKQVYFITLMDALEFGAKAARITENSLSKSQQKEWWEFWKQQ